MLSLLCHSKWKTQSSVCALSSAHHAALSKATGRKAEWNFHITQHSRSQVVPSLDPPGHRDDPQEPHTYRGGDPTSLMLTIPKRELVCERPSRSTSVMRKGIFEDQTEREIISSGILGRTRKILSDRKGTVSFKIFFAQIPYRNTRSSD